MLALAITAIRGGTKYHEGSEILPTQIVDPDRQRGLRPPRERELAV
jgi:hypothetical protein